jgi:hypothetical protein
VLGIFRQQGFFLQLRDRLAVGGVLAGVDNVRVPVAAAATQCLGQKPLRRLGVGPLGEKAVAGKACGACRYPTTPMAMRRTFATG